MSLFDFKTINIAQLRLNKITTIEYNGDDIAILNALVINNLHTINNTLENIKKQTDVVIGNKKNALLTKRQIQEILLKLQKHRVVKENNDIWILAEHIIIPIR